MTSGRALKTSTSYLDGTSLKLKFNKVEMFANNVYESLVKHDIH